MLTISTCVSKNIDVPYRVIEEEAIMVHVNNSEVIYLNEVATEIWKSIDGKRTIKDIIDHICEEFEVDSNIAQKDVIQFIGTLAEKNMVSY